MGTPPSTVIRAPIGIGLGAALRGLWKPLVRVAAGYFAYFAVVTAIHFPYHTDAVVPPAVKTSALKFYAGIYSASSDAQPQSDGAVYVENAKDAIQEVQIVPTVRAFVKNFGLENKRVLDVGAGTGYLQDVVRDYVGLDLSPTARRYFHKPFVEASATDMPFADGEFDAAWSIWVLEHVPNPEQGLQEIRRVVKDGGMILLEPAWNCPPWAADGYPVRPYGDFGIKGKLIKASLKVRSHPAFVQSYMAPIRLIRAEWSKIAGGPTRLHYNLLAPNFDHYWMSDSDAVNSLDAHEAMLWFTSRGDECMNCGKDALYDPPLGLIIRVHKQPYGK